MIRYLYRSLPGPVWLRLVFMAIMLVIAIALLVVFYEWVGNTFLDSGGSLG